MGETMETMKMDEYGYLKGIPVFSGLPDDQLMQIHNKTIEQYHHKGTFIFNEGDEGQGFYYVKTGKVKIVKMTEDGREHIIKILSAGDLFAEVLLFNNQPYPATAVAVEDSWVGMIHNADLEKLILNNNKLALQLIKAISQRLLYAQSKIKNLALNDVMARTAEVLLLLGREQGRKNANQHIEIMLDMSRHELANLVGTTRETVTRMLMQLKKDKIIEFSGHKLVLLRPEELVRFIS